jgi:tRNA-2-methylthio-N6-dimethylallyladenosine synthase
MYSPRQGTPAAAYPDQVADEDKRRRLAALNRMQERIAAEINTALIGATQDVLVEEPGRKGGMLGRTRTNKIVTFDGAADLIGRTVPVEIVEAGSWVLRGRRAAYAAGRQPA